MNNSNKIQDSGFILLTIMISVTLIILTGVATMQLSLSNLKTATNEKDRLNAQFSADAGIDQALQQINQDHNWTGTVGEITLYEDAKTKVTYQSTVTNDTDPFVKYIDVIGRTYTPKTNTTPKNIRKYQTELRGVGGGNFSIVTGVGGLTMKNNARIVDGSVYVNGKITMSNSAQIGLTILPVSVQVAHQVCPVPADATYPTVCASGQNGQSISMNNSAKIYGEVKATNQTNGSGMLNPGLVAGSPPAIALPNDHDRDAQKAAVPIDASNNLTGSSAGCSFGLKSWPANTKITGNVTIQNLCVVTVEGNIWITGNLNLKNISALKVKEGLATPPVIMIDGSSGLTMENGSQMLPNLALKGFRIITYYSTASCSPDCASVTGTDLFNSQSIQTIYLKNSSGGPLTEFYARWSKINVENSGNVGALVGQEIEMSNAAAVTFGVAVSGLNTPNAWVLKSYKRVY